MMIPKEIPPSVIEALVAGMPTLRAFREDIGAGPGVFAVNTGIDFERLRDIEAGQTPTPDEVRTIAAGLGVSVDDLNAALH